MHGSCHQSRTTHVPVSLPRCGAWSRATTKRGHRPAPQALQRWSRQRTPEVWSLTTLQSQSHDPGAIARGRVGGSARLAGTRREALAEALVENKALSRGQSSFAFQNGDRGVRNSGQRMVWRGEQRRFPPPDSALQNHSDKVFPTKLFRRSHSDTVIPTNESKAVSHPKTQHSGVLRGPKKDPKMDPKMDPEIVEF